MTTNFIYISGNHKMQFLLALSDSSSTENHLLLLANLQLSAKKNTSTPHLPKTTLTNGHTRPQHINRWQERILGQDLRRTVTFLNTQLHFQNCISFGLNNIIVTYGRLSCRGSQRRKARIGFARKTGQRRTVEHLKILKTPQPTPTMSLPIIS